MTNQELYEAFVERFTDDPVNWIKWGIVFIVFIISYIPSIKLYGKANWALSRDRKKDKAIALGHVISATVVKQWFHHDSEKNETICHATYEYTLNGKKKKYNALFYRTRTAPHFLKLYYINNPKHVFGINDYHWEAPKGCIMVFIIFLPFIIAALMTKILNVHIN